MRINGRNTLLCALMLAVSLALAGASHRPSGTDCAPAAPSAQQCAAVQSVPLPAKPRHVRTPVPHAPSPTPRPTQMPAPEPTPVPVALWTVTVDRSALREGPAKNHRCLLLLEEDALVEALPGDETPGWLHVRTARGLEGYLDAAQTRFFSAQAFALTEDAPAGWERLPRCAVRDAYDTGLRYHPYLEQRGNIAATVEPGETVHLIGAFGQYCHVVRAATGQTGYMLSAALEPVDAIVDWEMAGGVVGFDTTAYTYEEMLEDIDALAARYPQWLTTPTGAQSVLGRDIPLLRLGAQSARGALFINASIHGREFVTSMLLMEQLESALAGLAAPGPEGDALRALYSQVAVYMVPMANPDGVAISQFGPSSVPEGAQRDQILAWRHRDCPRYGTRWYHDYFPLWKSNAVGVDLNRNFDARWQWSASAPEPGRYNYKGPSPLSEPESRFLAQILAQYEFDAHLSYHSSGRALYWYFYQQGELYRSNYELSGILRQATGYRRATLAESKMSSAGFKDYAIMQYHIPGVTIETGSGETPVDPVQYPVIWEKCGGIMEAAARWVLEQSAEQP